MILLNYFPVPFRIRRGDNLLPGNEGPIVYIVFLQAPLQRRMFKNCLKLYLTVNLSIFMMNRAAPILAYFSSGWFLYLQVRSSCVECLSRDQEMFFDEKNTFNNDDDDVVYGDDIMIENFAEMFTRFFENVRLLCSYSCLLNGPTSASFCSILFFWTTILQKNCTLQQNSISDCQSRK